MSLAASGQTPGVVTLSSSQGQGSPEPGRGARFAGAATMAAGLPRLHSFLVSHHGTLVVERYFNGRRAAQLANVKSVSKSIISALVGIAIEQRSIPGVRETVQTYFPDVLGGESEAVKRTITIEDLLTMRSGLQSTSGRNYGAWVTSRHWVRHVLSRPMETEPGTEMEYSTGNSHVLSAIVTQATKKSTWQYAQETLAGPLGFTLARWPQDPQGIFFGGNDMLLTPRQMLAFGELYLNRGRASLPAIARQGQASERRLGERQVISSRWIDDSFVPRGRSDYNAQLYGYGWWMREFMGEQAYFAWGYGGQYIFIVPRLQLVVVTTSSTATDEERRGHRRTIFGLLEQVIADMQLQ
jgi:CubicO group peptidase (beta-lactamase class C family)